MITHIRCDASRRRGFFTIRASAYPAKPIFHVKNVIDLQARINALIFAFPQSARNLQIPHPIPRRHARCFGGDSPIFNRGRVLSERHGVNTSL